jgi:hypothetical protein
MGFVKILKTDEDNFLQCINIRTSVGIESFLITLKSSDVGTRYLFEVMTVGRYREEPRS